MRQRTLRGQAGEAVESDVAVETAEPTEKWSNAQDYIRSITIDSLKPYEGRDKLPKPQMSKDGRLSKIGEPRFFMAHRDRKIIAVYSDGAGISRSLYATIPKGSQGDLIRNKLKRLGIPGA